MLVLHKLEQSLKVETKQQSIGFLQSIHGSLIRAKVPAVALGSMCLIEKQDGRSIPAQAIAFQDDSVTLAPFAEINGVAPGAKVLHTGREPELTLSPILFGQVLNALGTPYGNRHYALPPEPLLRIPLNQSPPCALRRKFIEKQCFTGVAAIDAISPIGCGQRVAILATPGCGKSTLLGMIARHSSVDVTIVALIGERGWEVREFVANYLKKGNQKSFVVVAATSDEAPIRRKLALYSATALAEYFRKQGKDVLLLVDSLSRFARSVREVALGVGEVPVRQGYPVSLFSELPRIIERTGTDEHGSITAFYTLLTSAEGESDVVAEEAKGLLDGHLCLSQQLADRRIFPALDFTESLSRLAQRFLSPQEAADVGKFIHALDRLKQDRDITLFGGTPDAELKACLSFEAQLYEVMLQNPQEKKRKEDVYPLLRTLISKIENDVLRPRSEKTQGDDPGDAMNAIE